MEKPAFLLRKNRPSVFITQPQELGCPCAALQMPNVGFGAGKCQGSIPWFHDILQGTYLNRITQSSTSRERKVERSGGFRAPVVSIRFVFKELTSERVRRQKTHPTCAVAFCQIDISCLVSGLKGDFSHSFTGETCELHTAIHLER